MPGDGPFSTSADFVSAAGVVVTRGFYTFGGAWLALAFGLLIAALATLVVRCRLAWPRSTAMPPSTTSPCSASDDARLHQPPHPPSSDSDDSELEKFPSSRAFRPTPSPLHAASSFVCVVYLLALGYLFCLSPADARARIHALDPAGTYTTPRDPRIDERHYAADCRLWTPDDERRRPMANVDDIVRDLFVVAHVAGWLAKGLMLKDRWLAWTLSIGFELMETSLAGILPNFKECWWDKWVLDVLLCNLLGMELGLLVLRAVPRRRASFFWLVRPDKTGRYALAFVLLESRKRFLGTVATLVAFLLAESNAFFLKTVLWVEVHSLLNVVRLVVWTIIGFRAMSDIYQYLEDCSPRGGPDSRSVSLGMHTWLVVIVIFQELALIFKLGRDTFTAPFVTYFSGSTLALWIAISCVFISLYLQITPPTRQKHPSRKLRRYESAVEN